MAPLTIAREASPPVDLGGILALLAQGSARPRYAFLVLQLIAEAARPDGCAGPWVQPRRPAPEGEGDGPTPLREWLASQLAPLAARDGRRAALRERVGRGLGARRADPALLEAAIREEALAVGKSNVSRAVTDLVRAGLVRRHYAGRIKDHRNRGGGRHAVYVVPPGVLRAIRSRPGLV